MTVDLAIETIRRAVMLAVMVSAPMLLTALIVGVVVSLIQAVTQIQEQTLTFIPKLLMIAAVLILSLPWILGRLVEYLVGTIHSLSTMVT